MKKKNLRRKKYNKITLEGLLQGFVCYFAWIGALAMTILGGNSYVVKFHARQSIIFHVLVSLAVFILQKLRMYNMPIHQVVTILRLAILVFGTYHVATKQIVRYPIIGKYVN